MFREVLVPLDGSPIGEDAIPVAAAIASRHKSRLHFVTVSRPVVLTTAFPLTPEIPLDACVELDQIAREQLAEYVRRWADKIGRAEGIAVRDEVLDGTAAVAEQLFHYADHHHVDLIVMHTHARGVVGRIWLGSVQPVLPLRPKRILVPLDGSDDAELGVDFGMAMAVNGVTELRLLGVVNPLPFPTAMLDREALLKQRTATDHYLARASQRVAKSGIPVQTESVVHSDSATAILECVARHAIDLVSIAAPQRGAADRIFLGSVIDVLLRRSRIPMLVWRNRALAGTTLLPVRQEPMAGT